jgi:hypothetical protein
VLTFQKNFYKTKINKYYEYMDLPVGESQGGYNISFLFLVLDQKKDGRSGYGVHVRTWNSLTGYIYIIFLLLIDNRLCVFKSRDQWYVHKYGTCQAIFGVWQRISDK